MTDAMMTSEITSIEASNVPLERLESEICELAAHLSAATCRRLGRLPSSTGGKAGRTGAAVLAPTGSTGVVAWPCGHAGNMSE